MKCSTCTQQKREYLKEKKQKAINEAKQIAIEKGTTFIVYKEGCNWKYCEYGKQPKEVTRFSVVSKHT